MKAKPELAAKESARTMKLGNSRKWGSVRASCRDVKVMVEVASDGPIGEDIKIRLTRHLEESVSIAVSDYSPDWVFSIIAFDNGNLVELSVVLREFFRSTAPGTEVAMSDSSGQTVLRKGGWVYESLRYHGLHGVPKPRLGDFLKALAEGFLSQHLNLSREAKKQTQCSR
ncbi:MAG TPA: hypothetical protein VMC85_09155 [Desulfomonilaceae bacterium]|nr:hypothetical protein [Desulfomonilaceae bacterium]